MSEEIVRYPKVLSIAGSDSGGGAGIQADIKTISALGAYGMTCITALTAQNTLGVQKVKGIEPSFVINQLESIFNDIPPDAIKIGMVYSVELVECIADFLRNHSNIPIIFDPVMVASSGDRLIENDTIQAIVKNLFPIALLITPNMDEASIIAGMPVTNGDEMYEAAKKIIDLGCQQVIIKGGHLKGETLSSVWMDSNNNFKKYSNPKVATQNIHGAGCTFSSAVATFIALHDSTDRAISKAHEFVYEAIKAGQNVKTGNGNGPLNHGYSPLKMRLLKL